MPSAASCNLRAAVGGSRPRDPPLPAGVVTTIVGGLPSNQTSDMSRNRVSGVADVAFVGDTLHGVLSAGNLAQAEEVASGMMLPTGMTMGPEGNLYVSNFGFGFGAGAGQVLRIDLH